VVLNKTDLMDEAMRAQVEALVREELPPEVKIVAATEGRLPLALLLGQGRAAETTIHLRESHHDHEEDHDHDEFDSLVIELPPVDREGSWPRSPRWSSSTPSTA
jgi:cobalamin biosynthesis protein CobW